MFTVFNNFLEFLMDFKQAQLKTWFQILTDINTVDDLIFLHNLIIVLSLEYDDQIFFHFTIILARDFDMWW